MANNPGFENETSGIEAGIDLINTHADGLLFFTNETLGDNMHLANATFSGTPEKIHNGEDTTEWTASNLTGSNFVFTSTTHAKCAAATVVDYTQLSGVVVVVDGTNITIGTLTEGVEWTAATSNNATATSLASAYDGVAGISATATGAVVTVVADNAITKADITTFTSTDGTNLPVSAQSISGVNTVNGDEALFTDSASGEIDFNNFTAITLFMLTTVWKVAGTQEVTARFRNNGTNVGNDINLREFFDEQVFNEWHSVVLDKSEFGITTQTVDEFVIKTEATTTPPDYFIDKVQIEQTGSPSAFQITPPVGFRFNVGAINYTVEVADASLTSIEQLSPTQFFALAKLANGLVSRAKLNNIQFTGTVFTDNFDLIAQSNFKFTHFSTNGTNALIRAEVQIPRGLVLNSSTGDTIEQVVNDDFTSFVRFKAGAQANLEVEPT